MKPLDGPILKIERAKTHVQNLESGIADFHSRNPYSFVHEIDPDGLKKHVRIRIAEPPPIVWGGILGDAIHNIRASLDLLAVDLARLNGHTSNTALSETYFPISGGAREFETKGLGKIERLSIEDQGIIKGLKPYKGGDGPFGDALWHLHKLDIRDKHTMLVPGLCGLADAFPNLFIEAPVPEGVTRSAEVTLGESKAFPLKQGHILASYPASQPETSVQAEATFHIAFGEGCVLEGEPIFPTLVHIGQAVESIIVTFVKKYRPSGAGK